MPDPVSLYLDHVHMPPPIPANLVPLDTLLRRLGYDAGARRAIVGYAREHRTVEGCEDIEEVDRYAAEAVLPRDAAWLSTEWDQSRWTVGETLKGEAK